jgi:hypothetical protein
LQVKSITEIDRFFRSCLTEYRIKNLTNILSESLFQCPGTTKYISKHRLLDGIPDCYEAADEISMDACSLNQKHRFKCRSESKCISNVIVFDGIDDCSNTEDETYIKKKLLSFQEVCDGFTYLKPELIDSQNETDETNCEEWPCDNIYTRCDMTWSCLNGTDESTCYYDDCPEGTFSCILPYNITLVCLPISRANDGNEDCLGASDERSYCRSVAEGSRQYKCWNDSKCISANYLCEEEMCSFDDVSGICSRRQLLNVLRRMRFDAVAGAVRSHAYFFIPFTERYPRTINIDKHSASRNHIVKKDTVLREMSKIVNSLSNVDPWICNRGFPFALRTQRKYRCFCPPSYYGDFCQFQSQRVSLTLQIRKICAPDCQGVFELLVTLVDNEQTIHSHEQVVYVPTKDCNKKFNIYLSYNERPKDLNKTYRIRVDVYNKIDMSYHASWIFPIEFTFLPVNRISNFLILPATPITSTCSKFCAHGQCFLYVNTGKEEFCLCHNKWSGEHCTIPINGNCSSDSLCLGILHNRPICLCPMHKTGSRCLLPSICQSSTCSNKRDICIPIDSNEEKFKCLYWQQFLGDQYDYTVRLEISFSEVAIPQALLTHLIMVPSTQEPIRISTHTKIKLNQDEAVMYLPFYPSSLILFGQIRRGYYLLTIRESSKDFSTTKLTISPFNRCPHIRELVDERTSSFPLLRRVKYYHTICQKRSNLSCFHDEETFMCLCTTERHANCFHFEFNMTYDCYGLNDCKNGGECFPDNRECPVWINCVCPDCFYGSKCQFTTRGFDLSLDTILGYSIQSDISLSRQSILVKVSIAITTFIFTIGLLNGIVSTLVFKAKEIREIGCGYYLLISSMNSLLIVIIFTLKFVVFLLSQMAIITNHTFININCISLDFLLRSFLAINDWLNASIAIERAFIAIKGTNFNKIKSRQVARFAILIMVLFAFGSVVHDPIYRKLVEEKEDQRIWCIVQYPSFHLELFNSAINVVHFFLPFSINLVCAIVIIITTARQRASAQKQISYRQHLREQWRHHGHLIFSSVLLVLLAVPRLIISFLSGCMKSHRHPALFLAGYFISFVPPLLTFIVYILPSKTYKNHFDTLVQRYRTALRRLPNI